MQDFKLSGQKSENGFEGKDKLFQCQAVISGKVNASKRYVVREMDVYGFI